MNRFISASNLLSYGIENLPNQFDAILISSPFLPVVGQSAIGYIYFDENKRFEDDSFIRTSTVKNIIKLNDSYFLVETRNTTYLCVNFKND